MTQIRRVIDTGTIPLRAVFGWPESPTNPCPQGQMAVDLYGPRVSMLDSFLMGPGARWPDLQRARVTDPSKLVPVSRRYYSIKGNAYINGVGYIIAFSFDTTYKLIDMAFIYREGFAVSNLEALIDARIMGADFIGLGFCPNDGYSPSTSGGGGVVSCILVPDDR